MRPEMMKDDAHLKELDARCDLDLSDWQDFYPNKDMIPQIKPSRIQDSGAFTLLFCHYTAMGYPFDFTAGHIQMARERLTSMVLQRAKTDEYW